MVVRRLWFVELKVASFRVFESSCRARGGGGFSTWVVGGSWATSDLLEPLFKEPLLLCVAALMDGCRDCDLTYQVKGIKLWSS